MTIPVAPRLEPGTIYQEIKSHTKIATVESTSEPSKSPATRAKRNYVVVCGVIRKVEGDGVCITAKNEMVKIVNPFTGIKRWVSIGHFNNIYERVYKIPENGWDR